MDDDSDQEDNTQADESYSAVCSIVFYVFYVCAAYIGVITHSHGSARVF